MSTASTTPNLENIGLDQLSHQMLNIAMARRVFLLLTRAHFSDPSHYGHLAGPLNQCRWSADSAVCTLPVEYDFDYDPAKTDRRPAVFVGCGDVTMSRKVIDNSSKVTADGKGEEFANVGSYPVIIRHIGKTPDESLLLADLSFQFFLGIRKLMKEKAQLRLFEVAGVNTTRPFERTGEKTDKTFIADVKLLVECNMSWLIVRESHVIKRFGFAELITKFETPAVSTGV